MCPQRGLHLGDLGLAPNEAGDLRSQVGWTDIKRPQRRKIRAQARRTDLEQTNRGG